MGKLLLMVWKISKGRESILLGMPKARNKDSHRSNWEPCEEGNTTISHNVAKSERRYFEDGEQKWSPLPSLLGYNYGTDSESVRFEPRVLQER